MEALNTYKAEKTLAEQMNERLAELKMTKAEAALKMNYSRSALSQYLNGKYGSDPTELEKKIVEFLEASGGIVEGRGQENIQAGAGILKKKVEFFESRDFVQTIGVCQACQQDMGLGIIVGKSGQGKTHALKKYAELPRVAYIECDDTMACRDLVEAIENGIGLPRGYGGTIWSRVNRIREFFNTNEGFLLIIDEADKLINKYTQKKMEILRGIFDQSDVGIVIAGEPRLETELKGNLTRFANRMDFYYKYRAVISEAVNTKLWDEWEGIYTNLFNENHEEDARTFYEAHEEEMLLGAEVLWEEKLSYYDLMEIKVSEGTASFNSELQNDPIDPENATFNPEWFDYYEPELMDFKSPEFVFVAANDPSLGKNKKSDTSSIINLALSTKTGYMYVVDASVERRKPDVIIDDVFEMNRRLKRDYKKGFYKFGVEVVQFQYFFKEVMAAKSAEEGEYIPIEEIQSTVNKMLRIESLQPVIKNKYLKFNREHKTLLKQLQEFPMGKNDDAPDGLQMAVQLAQTVKAVASKANYKTVLRRRFRRGRGAY